MPATPEHELRLVEAGTKDTLSEGSRKHPRLSLVLSLIGCALLLPAFALLAPHSDWSNPVLIGALVAIELVAALSAVVLRKSFYFNAEAAVGVVAVVLVGPLPAFLIVVLTEVLIWIVERERVQASISNLASYGWSTIAASLVFAAMTGGATLVTVSALSVAAIVVAGFVLISVNFATVALLLPVLLDGKSFVATTKQDFVKALPSHAVQIALAALTSAAFVLFGVPALVAVAAIVFLPQILLPMLLRPKPITALSHAQAVGIYAAALANEMGADENTKTVLRLAAAEVTTPDVQVNGGAVREHLADGAEDPGDLAQVKAMLTYQGDIVEALLYMNEYWDLSTESPFAGVGGEMLPLTSRILAIANQWATLTATGPWTVTHAQAIKKIAEQADTRFDPNIVMAAVRVVAHERMGLTDHQPHLHEVPLPKLVGKLPKAGEVVAALKGGASWGPERTHP